MAYIPLARESEEAYRMSVCMGWDAMRICMGMQPRNYSLEDVARWFLMALERRTAKVPSPPSLEQSPQPVPQSPLCYPATQG